MVLARDYIGTMHRRNRIIHPEIKDHVVALKLNGSLVHAIDREAESEGLTRSAIIRRVLIERYRESEPVA